ncbi:AAA family ATPase [Roseiconus lacunae]|uniref:AAA family ATPase n=1 Tax=Roseiconus lacunae TaxID=2605694 RepID=A0ABT7PNB0_9BACT|nr:AAA family ATPase [Roseiconus lacunae]MDM4017764.1 AAA family ATPase [Roseiconus lacunae]WRQ49975.1 AAA family ATPase [Stieleria sp. HD01]
MVDRNRSKRKPKLTTMSDVTPRQIEWLWPGRIPLGAITLLAGPQGSGKSTLVADMAASVTNTGIWPDGTNAIDGDVLLLVGEDALDSVTQPRLSAHQAALNRCHVLEGSVDEQGRAHWFNMADTSLLRATLIEKPGTRLIVVDPLGSFFGSRADAHREADVREMLSPLDELAKEFGVAVVLVAHYRKAQGNSPGQADDAVLGSRAFVALSRSVWHLLPDPNSKERKLLLPGKFNLGIPPRGLAFSIATDEDTGVGCLHWFEGPVSLTADEVYAQLHRPSGSRQGRAQATAIALEAFLTGSVRTAGEMQRFREQHGIGRRHLDRAAQELKVVKRPGDFGGAWTWSLPKGDSEQKASSA